jgi:type II secretory pathway component PulF
MPIEMQTAAAAPPRLDAKPSALLKAFQDRSGISTHDRMLFTERLALLLETGMALHGALETLRQQSEKPKLRQTIGDLLEEVVGGKPLSVALAKHPGMFPSAYVNLIGAAEHGGFMAQALKQIMEMEDKQEKLRSTIVGALSYPVFLAFFSLAVVVFVLVGVFPKFAEMFSGIKDQLPLSTIVLMALSDILRQYWMPIVGGTVAAVVVLVRWWRTAAGKALVDSLKLKVPGLKGLFVQVYLVRMMRVMSASLTHGVSVLDTLAACREAVDNVQFRLFMLTVEDKLTQGRGLAVAFREEPFIPVLVKQMISTGEETGNLGLVMGRVADYYERELGKKISTISKMSEPVMLLVMGLVVGLIVASLILPIFKLAKGGG